MARSIAIGFRVSKRCTTWDAVHINLGHYFPVVVSALFTVGPHFDKKTQSGCFIVWLVWHMDHQGPIHHGVDSFDLVAHIITPAELKHNIWIDTLNVLTSSMNLRRIRQEFGAQVSEIV